ncbi:MAG: thioredoxin family protein [archaeon]|nr:thioredoxin family protein [archaeon]
MNLFEVDDRSWEKEVELAELPVLVMFYSPTCPHCKEMEPYFNEYAQEYSGKVHFARLNILENPFTAERYGIMATPTFKFFCNGKPVQELVGAAYPSLLKKLIADSLEYGKECLEKTTPIRFDPAYA